MGQNCRETQALPHTRFLLQRDEASDAPPSSCGTQGHCAASVRQPENLLEGQSAHSRLWVSHGARQPTAKPGRCGGTGTPYKRWVSAAELLLLECYWAYFHCIKCGNTAIKRKRHVCVLRPETTTVKLTPHSSLAQYVIYMHRNTVPYRLL